jgi:hypothetical protein
METPQISSRRRGREIVRARQRKEKIRTLVIGLAVGLLCAGLVGLLIWKFGRR